MNNIGKTAFVMVALGFPVYLLWKGRLGTYLSLASGAIINLAPVGTGTVTVGNAAMGTTTTYGPMGTPMGPMPASGLQNGPIPAS